jgi:hypothetical protein
MIEYIIQSQGWGITGSDKVWYDECRTPHIAPAFSQLRRIKQKYQDNRRVRIIILVEET